MYGEAGKNVEQKGNKIKSAQQQNHNCERFSLNLKKEEKTLKL